MHTFIARRCRITTFIFLALTLVALSGVVIIVPNMAHAAGLTESQIQSILNLLSVFGADPSVVGNVNASLRGQPATAVSVPTAVPSAMPLAPTPSPVPAQLVVPQQTKSEQPIAMPQNIPSFRRDLSFGMKGDDVRELQEFLTDQGYYAGPISGNYGLLTVQAVKKFQSANGISPTGYFGPRTRAVASAIMQKLISQICPQEEGCEGNVLPAEKIYMTADTDLNGTVSEYLKIVFTAFGGSGSYDIQVVEGDVPGLGKYGGCEISKADCPMDKMMLAGVPAKSGAFDVTFLVRERIKTAGSLEPVYSNAYGKERFTIVIKDKKSNGRQPVINGINGPTILKVGEEGVWGIVAQDPANGALVYRVVWGDERYQKEASAPSASQRATPFRQTATFAHTYYNAGVYTPTFYVVNDRGLEVKTSIDVNVGESSIGTGTIYEKVKCVFNGSTSEQNCSATTETSNGAYNYGCSGRESCTAEVKGNKGDRVTWKSRCGGYAHTMMDGIEEYAEFKCGSITPPIVSGQKFSIADVVGHKSVNEGDLLKLIIKGVEPDGTAGTPDEGFNVQVYIKNITSGEQVWLKKYSDGNVTANADFDGAYWIFGATERIKNGNYEADAAFYCSRDESVCAKRYGRGAQVNQKIGFSVGGQTAGTPSITVLSPNGGEQWVEGVDYKMTWRPSVTENSSLPKIDQYILVDATGNNYAIAPAINRENTGWDTWTPRGISGKFWLKICQTGTTNCDTSDAPFSIVAATPSVGTLSIVFDASTPTERVVAAGSIDVVASIFRIAATGEAIQLRQLGLEYYGSNPLDITRYTVWDGATKVGEGTFLSSKTSVAVLSNVVVQKDSDKVLIIKVDLANSAQVGNAFAINYNGDAKDSTSVGVGLLGVGVSSSKFIYSATNYDLFGHKIAVGAPAAASLINALSPNGGERWIIGSAYDVVWKSSGVEKVHIDITSGTQAWTIVSGVPASQGKYIWKIGENFPYLSAGDSYRIRVFSDPLPPSGEWKEGVNYDQTNAPFSILLGT